MRPETLVLVYALGAAAVALWLVARFPSLGPQTVTAALVTTIVVFVLQTPLLALIRPVGAFAGASGALVLVVLPALTLVFWSSACLVRTLVALFMPHRR